MTEEQITAKIMKISSDLGLRGHQTTDKIFNYMDIMNIIDDVDYHKIRTKFVTNWSFGDPTHIEIITEIERILTEKGILS